MTNTACLLSTVKSDTDGQLRVKGAMVSLLVTPEVLYLCDWFSLSSPVFNAY